ncbi:LysR family transcriptional regulator, partial [Bacillus subtilis]|nr:LysR family transcriptional regulator [Bacillus subtilis]
MTFDLRQLRAFTTIVASGSLGRAADALHVTQPALSRIQKRLEEQVGAPLFERRPRGLTLAEAGERLLAFAQRSLLEAVHVMKDIGGLDALHGSLLKIACSAGVAIDFLPGVLASF